MVTLSQRSVAVANSVMLPTQPVGCVKVVVIITRSTDTVVLGICVVVVERFEFELEDDDVDVIDVDDVELDYFIAFTRQVKTIRLSAIVSVQQPFRY